MIRLDKYNVLAILDNLLGEKGQKKKDENYAYHCPKCHHRKRKLEVDINSQRFHCWTCDLKGRKIRNLLYRLKASLEYIIQIDKIYGEDYSQFEEETEIIQAVLPIEFQSLAKPNSSIEYRQALNYIRKRGLTRDDILKYNIGYCEEGRYKNRVVIPSYDSNGRLNFFSSRAYYDSYLSYINCDASKDIVGFELFVDWNEPISLVEGAFDAIAIKRNAIPLFGKTVSQKLEYRIIEHNVRDINLILDNDALKSTLRLAKRFMAEGRNVKITMLEDKDPSKIGFENMVGIVKKAEDLDFASLIKLKLSV